MPSSTIDVPYQAIADLCRRNGIRRLSLFGSILGDNFGPESDIDILVEFEPGISLGLRYFGIEEELSQLFGRKVDLNTKGFLSPAFRDRVIHEAELVYDSGTR